MSSVFNWRDAPSDLVKRSTPYKIPSLVPKRLNVYAAAVTSNASLERQIVQVNREVEHHFALAQSVDDDALRCHHKDEARRLAAKVRALVQSRSLEYVAALEAERGLS